LPLSTAINQQANNKKSLSKQQAAELNGNIQISWSFQRHSLPLFSSHPDVKRNILRQIFRRRFTSIKVISNFLLLLGDRKEVELYRKSIAITILGKQI
jgi:hypothetical protein